MTLAIPPCWRYGLPVTVNPWPGLATRCPWRISAPTDSRRFCACRSVSWRLCVETFGSAGYQGPGSPTCAQLPPLLFGDGSRQLHFSLGANPMTTRNPSKARRPPGSGPAALRSNSSLAVRLNRTTTALSSAPRSPVQRLRLAGEPRGRCLGRCLRRDRCCSEDQGGVPCVTW